MGFYPGDSGGISVSLRKELEEMEALDLPPQLTFFAPRILDVLQKTILDEPQEITSIELEKIGEIVAAQKAPTDTKIGIFGSILEKYNVFGGIKEKDKEWPPNILIRGSYAIDIDILNGGSRCKDRECIVEKWKLIYAHPVNKQERKRVRKEGGLFASKAENKMKKKLRAKIIEECINEKEKQLWIEYDAYKRDRVSKAESGQLLLEDIGKGIGVVAEGVGKVAATVTGGVAKGALSGLGDIFNIDKEKVKIVAIAGGITILAGLGGYGAYKIYKWRKTSAQKVIGAIS
jgi:hypothetical protein